MGISGLVRRAAPAIIAIGLAVGTAGTPLAQPGGLGSLPSSVLPPAQKKPAPVQTAPLPPVADPAAETESSARRAMSPEELAAQDAASERLNAEVNARNAAAEARDRQRDEEYQASLAAREARIRAEQAAYDKRMADYRAQVRATEEANARAQARWQADVAACKAGDVSRCAKP